MADNIPSNFLPMLGRSLALLAWGSGWNQMGSDTGSSCMAPIQRWAPMHPYSLVGGGYQYVSPRFPNLNSQMLDYQMIPVQWVVLATDDETSSSVSPTILTFYKSCKY